MVERLMMTDPLSPLLDAVHLKGGSAFKCSYDGAFSLLTPASCRALYIVQTGRIAVVAPNQTVTLDAGDMVVLPHEVEHRVCDSITTPAKPIAAAIDDSFDVAARMLGTGTQNVWLSGYFSLDSTLAGHLLSALPEIVVVRHRDGDARNWLHAASHFLWFELMEGAPGAAEMVSRLLDILVIRALRTWASESQSAPSWLRGAADKRIGNVLSALHAEPGRDWTVEDMAQIAALSRSAFADHFQRLIGQSPLAYLTAWRLERAKALLLQNHDKLAEVAAASGYQSEAAFSRAFRKQFGVPPGAWRRRQPG